MKKIVLFSVIFLFAMTFFCIHGKVLAQDFGSAQNLVYLQPGDISIKNPELSQVFEDNLKGKPKDYFIDSASNFELYINILVPEFANMQGRYSVTVSLVEGSNTKQIAELDGGTATWQVFYNSFDRDWYWKGPELDTQLSAGKYKVEVYSKDNQGEYVLVVGKNKSYGIMTILNNLWQLPLLKVTFLKTSVMQFFLTPIGVAGVGILGAILIFLAVINYVAKLIEETIKHNMAKTLLLTSNGMQMKNEIVRLLQKPAYDVNVAFITTAAKPLEDLDFVKKDWSIMRDEMGFNVEEVDIEGKKESEVMRLLELKDIIYVEGGNAFFLLKAMRDCNFEKVIRKLLKSGKVYIGASAGSIVAGRTIQTAEWEGDGNIVRLKSLKGLNIVPFDIFVHYQSGNAEMIKQKIKNPKKRAKNLRILTDEQALLIQGKETDLIGQGEAIVL